MFAQRSSAWAPDTCSSGPTVPGRTARSNGSTERCRSSGPTVRSSSATPTGQTPLRHGLSPTTLNAATPHSEDSPRPAACHQPDGRVHLADLAERLGHLLDPPRGDLDHQLRGG